MPRRKSLYSAINQTVPLTPARSALFVVAVDLIPYLIAKLETMRRSEVWLEGEDTQIGDNLLGEQIMALIQPVMTVDNLYRFLDTNMRGTVYTVETIEGIDTIMPPIPIVPIISDAPIMPTLAKMKELSALFVSGDVTDIALLPEMSLQSRLQVVIDAINSGDTDTTAILAELAQIVLALA